jgi:hypothetical protein
MSEEDKFVILTAVGPASLAWRSSKRHTSNFVFQGGPQNIGSLLPRTFLLSMAVAKAYLVTA